MICYVLLCDIKLPTIAGVVETRSTFLNVYSNMFTAQRAIGDYFVPPNLTRLCSKEELEWRPKHAICNQTYVDRSQNQIYNFYVIAVDLEKNSED